MAVPTSVNDSGLIVGYNDTPSFGMGEAFSFSGGVMTELGTLGGAYTYSDADGVNDSNVIVGGSTRDGESGYTAFVDIGGKMTELNSVTSDRGNHFIDLEAAHAINNSGQIVGIGATYDDGIFGDSAFLLTPTSTPPIFGAIVPDSSDTALLVCLGLGWILIVIRLCEKRVHRVPFGC
jgi:probable HAF family extracellular repeat protein